MQNIITGDFKTDKKYFYKKLTGKQAVFKILNHLHLRIYNTELRNYFVNKFEEVIKFDSEIEKLYDAVFVGITSGEFDVPSDKVDFNKLRSKMYKLIEGYSFNLEKYFEGKYELDLLLASRSFSYKTYSLTQYTSEYFSFIYLINTLIEIIKFKTDKREIIGVDLKKGTVKYKQEDMMYDTFIDCFRTKRDEQIFERYLYSLLSRLTREYAVDDAEGLYFDTLDKIDDCIRLYKDTVILTDIINQKSDVKLEAPDYRIINIINDRCRSIAILKSIIENRDKITSPRGVTLVATENDKSEISSAFVKDIMLNDKPYVICSYKLKEPDNKYGLTENLVILPVKMSSILLATSETLIRVLYKFYNCIPKDLEGTGVYCDHEVISHEYWRYRKNNFIAPEDEEGLKVHRKSKRYFEVEIGVHTAKMGNASDSAKELAKKLGIQLKQGETLVRTHTRHYGKELLNEKNGQ